MLSFKIKFLYYFFSYNFLLFSNSKIFANEFPWMFDLVWNSSKAGSDSCEFTIESELQDNLKNKILLIKRQLAGQNFYDFNLIKINTENKLDKPIENYVGSSKNTLFKRKIQHIDSEDNIIMLSARQSVKRNYIDANLVKISKNIQYNSATNIIRSSSKNIIKMSTSFDKDNVFIASIEGEDHQLLPSLKIKKWNTNLGQVCKKFYSVDADSLSLLNNFYGRLIAEIKDKNMYLALPQKEDIKILRFDEKCNLTKKFSININPQPVHSMLPNNYIPQLLLDMKITDDSHILLLVSSKLYNTYEPPLKIYKVDQEFNFIAEEAIIYGNVEGYFNPQIKILNNGDFLIQGYARNLPFESHMGFYFNTHIDKNLFIMEQTKLHMPFDKNIVFDLEKNDYFKYEFLYNSSKKTLHIKKSPLSF